MRRLTFVIYLVLISAPCRSEIGEKELVLAGVNDCIKEAIGTSSVERNGPVIVYYCGSDKAKTLYNFLGKAVRAEIVHDSNGKFENRPFGNNACYHRLEDPSGKAADDFRCDLFLTLGDVLDGQTK